MPLKENRIYIANITVLILSITSLAACFINPFYFEYLGFITWCIPLFIVLNLSFCVYWAIKWHKNAWYSLMVLVLSWYHIKASFQISYPLAEEKDTLKILSYNTRVFNVYNHLAKKDKPRVVKEMFKWIVDKDFDLMCFQEFYYEPDSKLFNTISSLKAKRKYYHYFHKTLTNRINGQFGLAIFSKYKIIKSGLVPFDKKSNNQIVFIDVLIKADTIRVYNCHLISNNINDADVPGAEISEKNNERVKSIGGTLKRGFGKRGRQVDSLLKHIDNCGHKVILCGDLNDLPYSYTYRKLSSNLDNTFEKKGNGFGFSFNGKIPYLRIDNIFVSEGIKTLTFTTHNKVKHSDHFPISALVKVH